MKSLTFLVFYTNVHVVPKVVILYVRLNLVLEALCNFRSWVQDLETSKRGFVRGCCILFAEIRIATTGLTKRNMLAINQ